MRGWVSVHVLFLGHISDGIVTLTFLTESFLDLSWGFLPGPFYPLHVNYHEVFAWVWFASTLFPFHSSLKVSESSLSCFTLCILLLKSDMLQLTGAAWSCLTAVQLSCSFPVPSPAKFLQELQTCRETRNGWEVGTPCGAKKKRLWRSQSSLD